MDIAKMNKAVVISSTIIYTANIILSIALYSILTNTGLPVNNIVEKSVLISIPLMSALFNAIILTMIIMSLKLAEYYGIGKSILAIGIYLYFMKTFSPPSYLITIMIYIVILNIMQVLLLYYYAKLQKLMFG
jgi:hypothetical protein